MNTYRLRPQFSIQQGKEVVVGACDVQLDAKTALASKHKLEEFDEVAARREAYPEEFAREQALAEAIARANASDEGVDQSDDGKGRRGKRK